MTRPESMPVEDVIKFCHRQEDDGEMSMLQAVFPCHFSNKKIKTNIVGWFSLFVIHLTGRSVLVHVHNCVLHSSEKYYLDIYFFYMFHIMLQLETCDYVFVCKEVGWFVVGTC